MSQSYQLPLNENAILAALPREEFERIKPHLEPCELKLAETLYEPDEEPRYLYFPHRGMISLVTVLSDGTGVESATVGRDGIVGVSAYLGAPTAYVRAIVQLEGDSQRIPVKQLMELLPSCPRLTAAMDRYIDLLLALSAQSAACNRLHPVNERCARWLLWSHDRADGDEFYLTQEFLADMLGVRRPSVTVAAGALQQAGLITYRRGRMRVVNREGLEAASCECYGTIRNRLAQMLQALREPPRNGRARPAPAGPPSVR